MRGIAIIALCMLGLTWMAIADADFQKTKRPETHQALMNKRLTSLMERRGYFVVWERERAHNPLISQYERLKRGKMHTTVVNMDQIRTLLEESFRKAKALHLIELNTGKFLVVFERLIDRQLIGTQVSLDPRVHMHNGLWFSMEQWKEFTFSHTELRDTFPLIEEAATIENWVNADAQKRFKNNLIIGGVLIAIPWVILFTGPIEKRCASRVKAIARAIRNRKQRRLKKDTTPRSMPAYRISAPHITISQERKSFPALPAENDAPPVPPNAGSKSKGIRSSEPSAIKQEWERMLSKLQTMINAERDQERCMLLKGLLDELMKENRSPQSLGRARYALYQARGISDTPLPEMASFKNSVPKREKAGSVADLLPLEKLKTLLQPVGINHSCAQAIMILLLRPGSGHPYFGDNYVGFGLVRKGVKRIGFSHHDIMECMAWLTSIGVILWQDNQKNRILSCSLNPSYQSISYPGDEIIKLLVTTRQKLRDRLS